MNLRRTAVARMNFAVQGAELDDRAWTARKNSLIKQLQIQIPALRELKSGFIQTTSELSNGLLMLVVYLEESPQSNLRNLSTSQVDTDLYRQEVQRVRDQQANLQERFQYAVNTTDNPAESVELQEIRGLLWKARKGGRIHLYTDVHGEWMDIQKLSPTLTQSIKSCLDVKLHRINRDEVGVIVCTPLICPLTQRTLFKTSRKVSLKRHQKLRSEESSIRLAKLMHRPHSHAVEIEIEYSWVDGNPYQMTLVAIDGVTLPLS